MGQVLYTMGGIPSASRLPTMTVNMTSSWKLLATNQLLEPNLRDMVNLVTQCMVVSVGGLSRLMSGYRSASATCTQCLQVVYPVNLRAVRR